MKQQKQAVLVLPGQLTEQPNHEKARSCLWPQILAAIPSNPDGQTGPRPNVVRGGQITAPGHHQLFLRMAAGRQARLRGRSKSQQHSIILGQLFRMTLSRSIQSLSDQARI